MIVENIKITLIEVVKCNCFFEKANFIKKIIFEFKLFYNV